MSLRNFLVSLGLKEVITYSITAEKLLEKIREENFVKIINPLRQQENALRPTLLSGAIEAAGYNLNQKIGCLRLFEIADIYRKIPQPRIQESLTGECEEMPALAITLTDKENKVFYLKGLVEGILKFANLKKCIFKEKARNNFTNALEILSDNVVLGFLGKLDKDKKEEFDLKEDLYFAQINLEVLSRQKEKKTFIPFSRFPFVFRDISIAIEKNKKFLDIEETIKKETQPYLKEIEVIDTYQGKNFPAGHYSLTLRIYYQAENKTLTSREVDILHNKIRDILTKTEGVTLR